MSNVEMLSPEGGFYSTQDADSEGVEGKFFVWDQEQIVEVLGEEVGEIVCRYYDATDVGNFEGHNILHPSLELTSWPGCLAVRWTKSAG